MTTPRHYIDFKLYLSRAPGSENDFQVFSKVGTVKGKHTVAKLGKVDEGASINIEAEVDVVNGEHIGVEVDEI